MQRLATSCTAFNSKSFSASAWPFKKLWSHIDAFPFVFVCYAAMNPKTTNFLEYLNVIITSCVTCTQFQPVLLFCHFSVIYDECIDFLGFEFPFECSRSTLWGTSACLCRHVWSVTAKVAHFWCRDVRTKDQVLMANSAVEFFSFTEDSIRVKWQNGTSGAIALLQWFVDTFSCACVGLVSVVCAIHHCSRFTGTVGVNTRCFWFFPRTL